MIDKMAVNINGKTTESNMIEYSSHRVRFLNFIAWTIFLKIQEYISYRKLLMFEVGKCPKHSGSEAPLQRSYAVVAEISFFFKSETASISQLNSMH